MAYRVPPSRDPHLTLQPHPWGDGAAPPLAPPPHHRVPQRYVEAAHGATAAALRTPAPHFNTLAVSSTLNEEAVGASLLLPAHAHGRAVGAAAWPQVHPEVVRGA
jgi:hypothetical protein